MRLMFCSISAVFPVFHCLKTRVPRCSPSSETGNWDPLRLKRLAIIVGWFILACCWSGTGSAYTLSYSGWFAKDDDRAEIGFMLSERGFVSLYTLSFGGGINGSGDTIVTGGFAPIVSLFEADGAQALIGLVASGGGTCIGDTDAQTGFCWDVSLAAQLAAGSYLVVLTQDDNFPLGPFLSDGFLRDGQGDFTGPVFVGVPGQFILATGAQRRSHWALDINLPGMAIPEPKTLGIVVLGIVLLRGRRRPC